MSSSSSARELKRFQVGGLPLIHAVARQIHLREILTQFIPPSGREAIPPADVLYLLTVKLTLAQDPFYQLGQRVDSLDLRALGYDQMKPTWKGTKENLLAQVIRLVEKFITSPLLEINPPLFYRDETKRRVMLTLNMARIVQHVIEQIRFGNTLTLEPVFESNRPIRSTADMLLWFTGKPVVAATRSHINLCVADSTWEAQAAYELDHNPDVATWAKNDHLGFEIAYLFAGVFHKFRPDYLIRLKTGNNLVVETKGENTPKDETKRRYLDEWVKAVNEHGGFGKWKADRCLNPSDLPTVIHNAISE